MEKKENTKKKNSIKNETKYTSEYISLASYVEKDDICIKNLTELLNAHGIKTKFIETTSSDIIIKQLRIDFPVDKKKVGRKHKHINSVKFVPIKEIEKRLETQTAKEIAEEYGISRATLFRKLKEAKEKGYETIF